MPQLFKDIGPYKWCLYICVYQVQDQTGSITGSVQNKAEFADNWQLPASSCEG